MQKHLQGTLLTTSLTEAPVKLLVNATKGFSFASMTCSRNAITDSGIWAGVAAVTGAGGAGGDVPMGVGDEGEYGVDVPAATEPLRTRALGSMATAISSKRDAAASKLDGREYEIGTISR